MDNDPCVAEALAEILSKNNGTLFTADSLQDVLRLMREHSDLIDVVIAEIEPRAHGMAALAELRGSDHQVPVVILTALSDWDVYDQAVRWGAAAFVNKPITTVELRSILKRVCQDDQAYACDEYQTVGG